MSPMVAMLAAFVAAHGAGSAGASPECAEAWRSDGWCEAAKVGYVAGVEIQSPMLYEALDAHGHDVDPAAITCGECRKALETDGFCAAHRFGFVKGEAFLSPLTYHIARGRRIEPGAVACEVCREHTRGIGWCDKHRVGIAGHTAIDDRERFEELRRAYQLLLAAVETSARCETCGAAMVAEGACAIHRVRYKDGRAVPLPQP